MRAPGSKRYAHWVLLGIAALIPVIDLAIPRVYQITNLMHPIFILAVLGMGLNIVTGYTGLLNLGVAGFMAIGAYAYAILTCGIYPFQLTFWMALPVAIAVTGLAGIVLGLPTIRLRGDYLAIVTLGFGEIIQDSLKNLDSITKGTQGINPLPAPSIFGKQLTTDQHIAWFYLLLGLLTLVVVLTRNLEQSRVGRNWISLREDELAATCMGVNPVKMKLVAFAMGASLCGMSGALWAAYLGSSGDPGNYDFQMSIVALCIVIVGGMGNVGGILFGAFVMIGFNSIVLVNVISFLAKHGVVSGKSVFSSPANWKYLIFGLALILMMRFKPEGLLPSRRVREEMRAGRNKKPSAFGVRP